MLRILWNSRGAMMAQQEKLDAIANNISNVGTEGYKKVDVNFRDLVYEKLNRQGYPVQPDNSAINGTGVRAGDWIRDDKQGNLSQTNVNTDLAIDGEGYFEVTTPQGVTAYTRDGSFNIDKDGSVVDKNGNRLNITFNQGLDAESMRLTQDSFGVDQSGRIYNKIGNEVKEIGQIKLYNFVGQDSLKSAGGNLYIPNQGAQRIETDNFNIEQGYLEMSNVDLASEMSDMIITQRAFEFSSRGLKTADEMWSMANSLRSR